MTGDSMEVLDPTTTQIVVGGETLELRPLVTGAIPKIVRLARPVIDSVLQLDALPDEDSDAMVNLAMDMVEQHGDALFAAVGLAVGKDKSWVEATDLSEFVELCIKLVKVNQDFFRHRLAPLLAGRVRVKAGVH